MPRNTETVRLLEVDPELGAHLSQSRRSEAERELVVRTHRIAVGPWDVSRLAGASSDHVGLLVLDGVLSRELVVADQVSAELLGPGDLVRPWQASSGAGLLPVHAVWSVLSTVTLAVLDRRFAAEAARYPELTAALFDRLGERSLRLATTQAISQLTRVDRRLKALFWHLAERWGRVSGDGVVVPLALTHRILGQLVGARRPTVSTALSELAEREELVRRPDGSWLLRGDPPDAKTLARRPTAAELRGQDVMRPSRRIGRDPDDVDPDQLIAAMDRLREALDPGELRHRLDRRRGATS
jgi:CRP-like cAMP-binding protein